MNGVRCFSYIKIVYLSPIRYPLHLSTAKMIAGEATRAVFQRSQNHAGWVSFRIRMHIACAMENSQSNIKFNGFLAMWLLNEPNVWFRNQYLVC